MNKTPTTTSTTTSIKGDLIQCTRCGAIITTRQQQKHAKTVHKTKKADYFVPFTFTESTNIVEAHNPKADDGDDDDYDEDENDYQEDQRKHEKRHKPGVLSYIFKPFVWIFYIIFYFVWLIWTFIWSLLSIMPVFLKIVAYVIGALLAYTNWDALYEYFDGVYGVWLRPLWYKLKIFGRGLWRLLGLFTDSEKFFQEQPQLGGNDLSAKEACMRIRWKIRTMAKSLHKLLKDANCPFFITDNSLENLEKYWVSALLLQTNQFYDTSNLMLFMNKFYQKFDECLVYLGANINRFYDVYEFGNYVKECRLDSII